MILYIRHKRWSGHFKHECLMCSEKFEVPSYRIVNHETHNRLHILAIPIPVSGLSDLVVWWDQGERPVNDFVFLTFVSL